MDGKNYVLFCGKLTADVFSGVSSSNLSWARLNIEIPNGKSQTRISCSVFGEMAERIKGLKQNDMIELKGRLAYKKPYTSKTGKSYPAGIECMVDEIVGIEKASEVIVEDTVPDMPDFDSLGGNVPWE